MQCDECDKDVPAESLFCPHCGARLAADDPAGGRPPNADRLRPGGQRSNNDSPAEEELWSGTYSPKAMAGKFAAATVLTAIGIVAAAVAGPPGWLALVIGAAIVWGGLILVLAYRRLTVRYRLTNFRFFHEEGLLSRVGNRVEVIDIDDVTVKQGLVERMFGVGTISILSSDTSHPKLSLPGIDDAKRVADMIDGVRRDERQRRGLYMESV